MNSILVCITTHGRAKWCEALINQIFEQSTGFKIQVAVFHDACDDDYSGVLSTCKTFGYDYFLSKKTFGKWGYWKLLNLVYAYADSKCFDYFIQMPDDVILVSDFFSRLTKLIVDEKTCVNYFTPNVYLKINQSHEVCKIRGVDAWRNGWMDSAFCTTKKIMRGFRIAEPLATRTKKENKGSGCGSEQSRSYFKKSGRRALHLVRSMCEHIGFESTVMHNAKRAVDAYGADRCYMLSCNLSPSDLRYIETEKHKFGIMTKIKQTVAVVGSAAYLKNKGLGKEIDSCDLVVRVNFNALLCDKHPDDIGIKTDVIYMSSTTFQKYKNIKWPKGATVRKKNGGLQNLSNRRGYCMNTGFIAVLEYAMKGYDVRIYGMDFYAGVNDGKIIEKPLNEPDGGNFLQAPKDKIYLPGYYESVGIVKDDFAVRHVGGMEDLRIILEYQQQYCIRFDCHMQNIIINSMKKEIEQVDVYIAALWRDMHVATTIESLLKCAELRSVSVVCNNWTDEQFEKIRIKFAGNIKVILYRGDNKKGCSEKFRYFKHGAGRYICNCDDDLTYPKDFFTKLIDAAERYKAAISVHGRVLLPHKIDNYYKQKKAVYHCLRDVENDVEVDIIGTGGSIIRRDLIPDIAQLYDYVYHKNMSDIYFSYLCKIRGIKRIVLKHEKGWLQHKEMKQTDNYIFNEYKDNCKPQTEFVNRYFIAN